MKRKELFEFEDFKWLPSNIRDGAINLLYVFHKMVGTPKILTHLITDLRNKYSFNEIVDLGSGAGGPMIDVIQELNKLDSNLSVTLSDLYPNKNAIDKIRNLNIPNLKYSTSPVNATNLNNAPIGLKTMIASFHHMNPTVAQQILLSAQKNKQAILIYEVAKNNIPFIVWLLFLPVSLLILFVMALVMTLFVRPLSFSQIFFTYIIPIIPIVYAWDGQASLMRTYTFDDIKALLKDESSNEYNWEIAETKRLNKSSLGYYIIGYPNE